MVETFELLAERVDRGRRRERRQALEALVALPDERAGRLLAAIAVDHEDPLRGDAIDALGRWHAATGRREAWVVELLIALLVDRDEVPAREDAALALGELRAAEAIDALCDALLGALADGDPTVGPRAAWALAEIGDVRAIPALCAVLEQRCEGSVLELTHREALFALARFGEVGPIEAFLADVPDGFRFADEARVYVLDRARSVAARRAA